MYYPLLLTYHPSSSSSLSKTMTMMRMRKISDVDVDEEDEDVTKVVPYVQSTYLCQQHIYK